MLKFLVFMSRKAEVPLDVFKRHYEMIHAPLSLEQMGFAGYSRNYVIETLGMPRPEFDVMTSFWYRDEEHMRRTLDGLKSNLRYLGEDGDLFIDRPKTWSFVVEERWSDLPGAASGAVKFIALLKRKADTSREAFIDHYESVHAPLIMRLSKGLEQYRRNFTVPVPGAPEPAFDSVTELWYRDMDAYKASLAVWASEDGKAIRSDEASFLDRQKTVSFLADECVSVAPSRAKR